ncbi:uncharacterized protein Eint_091970 [Encephalitozoon intestinalis ATCC 50506]|uniref:Uncharacterized protein n=1 Tax=Encephalitozoon intestinalis (strain ATCC 50506) TaxID=876142 RepID=E0S988_ENCIT|nr:uncharacterized protein Eint_091970 [Encephalitozoon intestinalis ATCC 50506]ADM12323.1 hypothetical protein Eint_091970 [Encephalitozoon intestinalis ATCC 50506]UTX46135.1 hypothetical protein GPK93_09g17250 [Encephalitozoon intestinalis]
MGENKDFISPLDLAKRLRSNVYDPVKTLLSIQCLSRPLSVDRSQVRAIRRLSKFLFSLSLDKEVLVSLAFNPEAVDTFMDFGKIVMHREYNKIYYCIDIKP